MNNSEQITVSEVARLFGVSLQTVYHWVACEWLHGEKKYGRILISRAEIQHIIELGSELEPDAPYSAYPRIVHKYGGVEV